MTTGGDEPVFVDTNILVFSSTVLSPLQATALAAMDAYDRAGVPLWISRQIMREYAATVTRPQTFGVVTPMPSVVAALRYFERRFRVAEDGPTVTRELVSLLEQFPLGGKQVHDANIVATMRAHGIPRLLTHNAADFARYAGLITVVPLVPAR